MLAVLLYHAELPWMPGGYLGVEVFFVLSGYLITSLLLSEWWETGRVNLGEFWLRRARRLLPALFFLLAATALFSLLFLPDEVAGLRGDVAAAGGYVTNWYLIFNQESYFEFVGRPSLLQHLWSLAIEEQFYLLWPLLFIGWISLLRSRRGMALVSLAGAATSAVLMAALYVPDLDPSRIYYGTDTRASGLLLGCALAFAWIPARRTIKARANRTMSLDLVGLVALGALIWLFVNLDETQPFLYQGGFVLIALVTAALIGVVVHPQASLMPGLLGWGPLRWLGLRSYSLYLWHWPIFAVTRPELDVPLDGAPLLLLRLALTVAMSEVSYRYVETPIRRGLLGKQWSAWREAQGTQRRLLSARFTGATSIGVGLALLLVAGLAGARPPATPDYLLVSEINTAMEPDGYGLVSGDFGQGETLTPTETATPALTLIPSPTETATIEPPAPTVEGESTPVIPGMPACPTPIEPTSTPTATPRPPTHTPAATLSPTPTTAYPPLDPPAGHIVAIGDSVMIGAARQMQKEITDLEIDASVSRQVANGVALLKARRQAGRLGDVMVIHLGSNGTFTAKQFDQLMAELKDVRRVVFVNVKVPKRWEGSNNKVIAEGVARYPNTVLFDWRAASAGHPEYFAPDGVHLRGEGVRLYTRLIGGSVGR